MIRAFTSSRTNFATELRREVRVASSHILLHGAALRPSREALFVHALRKITSEAKLVRGFTLFHEINSYNRIFPVRNRLSLITVVFCTGPASRPYSWAGQACLQTKTPLPAIRRLAERERNVCDKHLVVKEPTH